MPSTRTIHEQLYLGIDGGASNITVAIANARRQIVFQHTANGGANHHAIGLDQAVANLEEVIQSSVDQTKVPPPVVFDGAVFGLSGCNFDPDQDILLTAIKRSPLGTCLSSATQVVNDSRIALKAGAPDEIGIVLVVGTGSNCLGRAADGRQLTSGGLDYILSDEGSGYDIGLRTLKAITRQLDGRGEPTKLTKEVFTELGVDNLQGFHQAVYRRFTTKAAIASLATITTQVADTGDTVAQQILNHSANELLKMVDAVMNGLDMREMQIPIVLVGSVISNNGYLRRRLETELRRINLRARLINPSISPAAAAALMAVDIATTSKASN